MESYVARMVKEHANLVTRIKGLDSWVNNPKNVDDKIEFANKCVQLRGMKQYELGLRARLENRNIHIENGQYSEVIGNVSSLASEGEPK